VPQLRTLLPRPAGLPSNVARGLGGIDDDISKPFVEGERLRRGLVESILIAAMRPVSLVAVVLVALALVSGVLLVQGSRPVVASAAAAPPAGAVKRLVVALPRLVPAPAWLSPAPRSGQSAAGFSSDLLDRLANRLFSTLSGAGPLAATHQSKLPVIPGRSVVVPAGRLRPGGVCYVGGARCSLIPCAVYVGASATRSPGAVSVSGLSGMMVSPAPAFGGVALRNGAGRCITHPGTPARISRVSVASPQLTRIVAVARSARR
jgi:hypothetical protein